MNNKRIKDIRTLTAICAIALVMALAIPGANAVAQSEAFSKEGSRTSPENSADAPHQERDIFVRSTGSFALDSLVLPGNQNPANAAGSLMGSSVSVNIKTSLNEVSVPYGVDIEDWVNNQEHLFEITGASFADAKLLFTDGKIVVFGSSQGTYPNPGDNVGFLWGAPVSSTQVNTGDITKLSAKLSKPKDWFFEGVELSGDITNANAASRMTSSNTSNIAARLWKTSNESFIIKAYMEAAAPQLSFAQGSLTDTTPPPSAFSASQIQFPATNISPTVTYARFNNAHTFFAGTPNELRLEAGEVVKLPLVCNDGDLPEKNGNIRVSGGTVWNDTVYSQRIEFSFEASDSAYSAPGIPATGGDQVNLAAGLARASLVSVSGEIYDQEIASTDSTQSHTFTLMLDSVGTYLAQDLFIEVEDRVGHIERFPLNNLADSAGNSFPSSPANFIISVNNPSVSLTFANNNPVNSGYYTQRVATVTVNDPHFEQVIKRYQSLSTNDQALVPPVFTLVNKSLTQGAPGKYFTVTLGDFAPNGLSNTYTFTLASPTFSDGLYSFLTTAPTYQSLIPGLTAQWSAASDHEQFTLDTVSPAAGKLTILPNENIRGTVLFARDSATLTFALDDATSGIDEGSVAVLWQGQRIPLACSLDPASSSGLGVTAIWTPPASDTIIGLTGLSLSFADKAGNISSIADISSHQNVNINVVDIFVDGTDPVISVDYSKGALRGEKYYAAGFDAVVTIKEASFPFLQQIDPGYVVATRFFDGQTTTFSAKDFSNPSGDATTWVLSVPCEPEGFYRIEADLTDLSGNKADSYRGSEFVVDTTAPIPGAAVISPVVEQQGGWLFSQGEASVVFALSDATSGINPGSVTISEKGTPIKIACIENPDGKTATATWHIAPDDRSISLSDIALSFADKAGNAFRIDDLEAYMDKNIMVDGIFADRSVPVLSVSFDNDDVRNQKYYNASRTATVSLFEASFSFVQLQDPTRVVATLFQGEQTRTLQAKDFTNPSGDGATWIAALICESENTYRLEADFTDFSGRVAAPYRGEEFIVDMTDPLILMTFDNNESEGGMYFKAPRTASITILEENFSSDLTSSAISARDSAGNGVTAPSTTGWSQNQPSRWATSVGFYQELHYGIELACTDLAGNAAQMVSEPEFVIDTTLPRLAIERVSDHVAYKDEIAPFITFEDTNFEPYLTEVTLTGANNGEVMYLDKSESTTEISRTLEFADFDYEVKTDDVYTLSAKVKDRAGNEVQDSVSFSVNRFGSNYELSENSRGIVGSYMKRGQNVVLTETNVSGISSLSATLAHNDQVRTLAAGSDYTVGEEGGQGAWSRYVYTFPADLFAQDGYYRIMISSVDVAGSLSENLMANKNADRTGALEIAFAVDGTSPMASLGGISANTSYHAPMQKVDAYINDNIMAEQAFVAVNGEVIATWDAESLATSGSFSFNLPASDSVQNVRLEVRDKAGNTYRTTLDDVMVTEDFFKYLFTTPSLLYPCIAVFVILTALFGTLLVRLVIKKNVSTQEKTC